MKIMEPKSTPLTYFAGTVQKPKPKWSCLVFVIGVIVTIGTTVPVGYSLASVNTLSDTVQDWYFNSIESRYAVILSESKIKIIWASIVSLFLVGGIIGSFVSAWYCDMYGRKGTLVISACLLLLSSLFVGFCKRFNSIEMLIVGRLIGGIAAALTITAQPMYLMEIAPLKYQGTMGAFTCIGITLGIVISQIVTMPNLFGTPRLWPCGFSFFVLFVILFLFTAYWLPESPRWLYLIKENPSKAKENLMCLRQNSQQVETEMKAMSEQNIDEDTKGVLSTICDTDLLVPFVLVCSYQFCQQLCGFNIIFYYSVEIFVEAGFTRNLASWMTLSMGCLNLLVSLFSPIIVSSLNRRPILMVSFGGCSVALIVLSFTINFSDELHWRAIIAIGFIFVYLLFYQVGIGPISFFIGSELFEVAPRPVAMSMGSLCNWTGNFLVAISFPPLYRRIGSYAFLPCAAVCIYGLCLTHFCLPETRKRSITEVVRDMREHFSRRSVRIRNL